ncbi:hypothetical protein HYC85_011970 [Camellia sinensis]|uniref:Uncharacterized protein n=1 Tax=Camellia sinensis TaxID=4442 RepID=A0A7J7HBS4_CAMSI|nr:hypothetical protein HYC85_011970 [Camellia sinensis]
MFFGWSAKVAHEFGAFHAIFNAGGGYGMAAFHSLWLHLPYKKVNSEEFPLPGFRKGNRIHTKQLPEHFQVAVPDCLPKTWRLERFRNRDPKRRRHNFDTLLDCCSSLPDSNKPISKMPISQ